jgi:hypothetical protein
LAEGVLGVGEKLGVVVPSGAVFEGIDAWSAPPMGKLERAVDITPGRVAYLVNGVWSVERGHTVDTVLTIYHSASDDGVRTYLVDYPHLVPRLWFFREQVTALWGASVANTLQLSVETDPEYLHPALVVWAEGPHILPDDAADGKLQLFRGQRERFGAWDYGIGFSLVIVDAMEDD